MLAFQECQNTLLKEKYVGNYVIFEKCVEFLENVYMNLLIMNSLKIVYSCDGYHESNIIFVRCFDVIRPIAWS